MELDALKKLIQNTSTSRNDLINNYKQAVNYYENKTDITTRNNGKAELNKEGKKDPLRSADNRIPSNFYQLLVDQEAGYVASVFPDIDVGKDTDNQKILDVLGDDRALTLNGLLVDSSNAGRAWLHYWIDEDNNFRYGIIQPDQITPVYATTLDNKLLGVLRSYKQLDPEVGKYFTVHEYWTDKEAQFFKTSTTNSEIIEPYNIITSYDLSAGYETGQSNTLKHNFGRVPFIEFPKNKYRLPELNKYKGLIDAYDDIYNGFINDLDDVQTVILVLTNYGGASLKDFMNDLKKYKSIKINNAGNGDKSGVDKLQIDIPVEARDDALKITRDNIFLFGQGIDPANFESSNASGVAIKMLYSHLELKAAKTQTYFEHAINELIRAIMRYLNFSDADKRHISQHWTRTKVEDSLTKAQIVSTVANYSSKEAVAKANPIVDDWQQELKDLAKDREENDPYSNQADELNGKGVNDEE
ncbi:phage portal protein [Lactobacillus johnsonii]|uniref:phage portal protein n=1 Tax=Lactobacillus johnsonii TaxID=33959 RepID=UPI000E331315|nr:phage portal protein [Lactobacillus johnsonii]AXQ19339.1 phage portal protein [Lactobacillus johnsonii]